MYSKFNDIDIYDMKMHQHVLIAEETFRGSILRVPGGWIYESEGYNSIQTTFVPYDNEFQGKNE